MMFEASPMNLFYLSPLRFPASKSNLPPALELIYIDTIIRRTESRMPQNNIHFGAGVPSSNKSLSGKAPTSKSTKAAILNKSATGQSKESAPTSQPAIAKLGSLVSIIRSIGAKVGRTALLNSKPAAIAEPANSVAALDARVGKTTAPALATVKSRLPLLPTAKQKARETVDESTPAPKRIGRPPGSKNKFKRARKKNGLLASSAQATARAAGGAIAASAAEGALPPHTAKPASMNLGTQKGDRAAGASMQKAESAQKAGGSESSKEGRGISAVPAEAASHAEEGGEESTGGVTATTEVVESGLAAESAHTMSTGRMRAAEMGAQSSWEGEP